MEENKHTRLQDVQKDAQDSGMIGILHYETQADLVRLIYRKTNLNIISGQCQVNSLCRMVSAKGVNSLPLDVVVTVSSWKGILI